VILWAPRGPVGLQDVEPAFCRAVRFSLAKQKGSKPRISQAPCTIFSKMSRKKMFRSICKRRFVCFLAFAFLLSELSGCSYWRSRRAKAVARGNHLFKMHCGGCHGPRRLDLEKVPPDLNGVFARRFLPSGRPATDDVVRSTILTGRGGIMPSFERSLSDEDIQDIILYLHTLKAPPKAATPAAGTPVTAASHL